MPASVRAGRRPAAGDQLPAQLGEAPGQVEQAGLVVDREQRPHRMRARPDLTPGTVPAPFHRPGGVLYYGHLYRAEGEPMDFNKLTPGRADRPDRGVLLIIDLLFFPWHSIDLGVIRRQAHGRPVAQRLLRRARPHPHHRHGRPDRRRQAGQRQAPRPARPVGPGPPDRRHRRRSPSCSLQARRGDRLPRLRRLPRPARSPPAVAFGGFSINKETADAGGLGGLGR